MTEAMLKGGQVEFGTGCEMQFFHGGQQSLHHVGDHAVVDKIGLTLLYFMFAVFGWKDLPARTLAGF